MLVVIPTYKRLNTLPWVIKSLLNCTIPKLEEKPRLAIVNNFPSNVAELDHLINKIRVDYKNSEKWEWIKIDRKESLNPIDNWYNAIFELASDNEIVFLHGDDDLFLKDSIEKRYEVFNHQDYNLLLSKAFGGFTFFEDNNAHIVGDHTSLGLDESISEITFSNFKNFAPVFIGNNTYKNNLNFRDIYNEAQKLLLNKQGWIPYNMRTLMMPYYLPLMYLQNNLSVGGLNKICVIRGTSLKDKLNAPFGVPGWNSGFLGLLAYDLLNNEPFRKIASLEHNRKEQLRMAKSWYLTFFMDKRIPKELRITALKNISIDVSFKDLKTSFLMLIKELFGLSNLKIRYDKLRKKNLVNLNEFIQQNI